MTPRQKASPGEQIAALERLKEQKLAERDAAQTALSGAYDLLGVAEGGPNIAHPGPPRPPADGSPSIPARLKHAEHMEELDRPHEPFEEIRAAEAELHNVIKAARSTIERKTDATGTLIEEIAALRAEHRAYFIACAEEGSAGAEAQLGKVLEEVDSSIEVLRAAWDGWTLLEIPIATDDALLHIRLQVEELRRRCCYPRGGKGRWEESKAAEHQGTRMTSEAA
jgi:hypothetical protein